MCPVVACILGSGLLDSKTGTDDGQAALHSYTASSANVKQKGCVQ